MGKKICQQLPSFSEELLSFGNSISFMTGLTATLALDVCGGVTCAHKLCVYEAQVSVHMSSQVYACLCAHAPVLVLCVLASVFAFCVQSDSIMFKKYLWYFPLIFSLL